MRCVHAASQPKANGAANKKIETDPPGGQSDVPAQGSVGFLLCKSLKDRQKICCAIAHMHT